MSARRFRSREGIQNSARLLSLTKGWNAYKGVVQDGKACSFSLETLQAYYGEDPKDRKSLVELYGDGGTLYIVSLWNNFEKELDENDARKLCRQIVEMGYVPFIGIWYFMGRRYEEPSFAIDHGVSEAEIRVLLETFGQRAVYVVTYDRAESVCLESLAAGP